MEPAIRTEGLTRRFGHVTALDGVSFEVRRGEMFGLIGPDGAGKTTLFRLLATLLKPHAGKASVEGHDIVADYLAIRSRVGYMPGKFSLYPDLTVDEYLVHCAVLRRVEAKKVRAAVDVVKDKCSIAHFSRRLIKNLSGGYQQRVGIAQAIVHNPPFVVLDEPTNGLDPNQVLEIRGLIKEIAVDHSVLLSTHNLAEVQATCNNIRMIEHGHMVFSGSMQEFNNYAVPNSLKVVFALPPAAEELKAIPNVLNVEHICDGLFKIRFDGDDSITERIIAHSIEKGWRLKEISLEHHSLETIFAQLSGKLRNNNQ